MLAIQLINHMKVLHGKGIVHWSIRPDHIVVDIKTNVVYLISFSGAKWLDDGTSTGKHRALYN
jgi:serine/threonine protein kinase